MVPQLLPLHLEAVFTVRVPEYLLQTERQLEDRQQDEEAGRKFVTLGRDVRTGGWFALQRAS